MPCCCWPGAFAPSQSSLALLRELPEVSPTNLPPFTATRPRPPCTATSLPQGLNVVRPSFFAPALAELAGSLVRLSSRAAAGLAALAGMDPQSATVLTTGTARYGKLMLVSGGLVWCHATVQCTSIECLGLCRWKFV